MCASATGGTQCREECATRVSWCPAPATATSLFKLLTNNSDFTVNSVLCIPLQRNSLYAVQCSSAKCTMFNEQRHRKCPQLRTWSSWGPKCWSSPHLVLILHESIFSIGEIVAGLGDWFVIFFKSIQLNKKLGPNPSGLASRLLVSIVQCIYFLLYQNWIQNCVVTLSGWSLCNLCWSLKAE